MKLLFQVLLLSVMLALQKCEEADGWTSEEVYINNFLNGTWDPPDYSLIMPTDDWIELDYEYNTAEILHDEAEGVSVLHICFSSLIAVVLVIMTAAVIVTTIRSKAKDSTNSTNAVTEDDYMDA